MPRRILDAPFENGFPILLEKGETILWKGDQIKNLRHKKEHPFSKIKKIKIDPGYYLFIIFIGTFLINAAFINISNWQFFLGVSVSLFLFLKYYQLIFEKIKSLFRKKFKYYLTQKRLIIHSSNRREKKLHVFNLNDITNIQILNSGEYGTITFQVIEQPTTDILFRKNVDSQKKMFGRIEGIENAEEVIQIMKQTK